MSGATRLGQTIDARFDARERGETSERGFFTELAAGPVEGLAGSPSYLTAHAQVRVLQPETDWISAAARLDWRILRSPRAPFYAQRSLGGACCPRGVTEDRFSEQNAWGVELA